MGGRDLCEITRWAVMFTVLKCRHSGPLLDSKIWYVFKRVSHEGNEFAAELTRLMCHVCLIAEIHHLEAPSASSRSLLVEKSPLYLQDIEKNVIIKKEIQSTFKDFVVLSSRFSITWWFCRFLKPPMRWCFLLGGTRSKWRHLKKKRRKDLTWSCRDKVDRCRVSCTCVSLQLLYNLLRLQVPDVHHVVLWARHDPLRDSRQSMLARAQTPSAAVAHTLTFPPVTEKLANMQYFSFLCPVYVFRHWKEHRHVK